MYALVSELIWLYGNTPTITWSLISIGKTTAAKAHAMFNLGDFSQYSAVLRFYLIFNITISVSVGST